MMENEEDQVDPRNSGHARRSAGACSTDRRERRKRRIGVHYQFYTKMPFRDKPLHDAAGFCYLQLHSDMDQWSRIVQPSRERGDHHLVRGRWRQRHSHPEHRRELELAKPPRQWIVRAYEYQGKSWRLRDM